MMHKAWSSIEEVPYCFSRSSVKFQGYTALKIVDFDPNWAFPDCNSSLNSPMAMKCCTKLETAKKRCPIVFQGHPSNFKVTRDKTSPILTQIGRFRTIGRSQLSNPSDLPCSYWSCVMYFLLKAWTRCLISGMSLCTGIYNVLLKSNLFIFYINVFLCIVLSVAGEFCTMSSRPVCSKYLGYHKCQIKWFISGCYLHIRVSLEWNYIWWLEPEWYPS